MGPQEGPTLGGGLIRKGRISVLEKLRGRMWDGNSVSRTGLQGRACNRYKSGKLLMEQELRTEPRVWLTVH